MEHRHHLTNGSIIQGMPLAHLLFPGAAALARTNLRAATAGIALMLLVASPIAALEHGPVRVLKAIAGDAIEVEADLDGDGVKSPTAVRLLHVCAPDATRMPAQAQQARDFVTKMFAGTSVLLWTADDTFTPDKSKMIPAIACRVHADDGKVYKEVMGMRMSIQEAIIYNGWSVYWQIPPAAAKDFEGSFMLAQSVATRAKRGLWATDAAWMTKQMAVRAGQ